MNTPIPVDVSVQEVQEICQSAGDVLLLDCRQPEEHQIVHLPGATLIPMDQLAQRLSELSGREQERIVVYCHHGMRSEMVAHWLREQGFASAQSMVGGIDAWSTHIDPQLPRY